MCRATIPYHINEFCLKDSSLVGQATMLHASILTQSTPPPSPPTPPNPPPAKADDPHP
jgi:hypothetical protein